MKIVVVVVAAAAAVLLWSTAPANASAASWFTGTFKRAPLSELDDDRRNSHSNIINARLENNGLQTQPQTLASNDGSVDLNNVHDLLYLANLTVGGTQYVVQLDSGSSDLVLFTNVPNAKSSGLTLNLTYGVGFAYGSISTAEVSLADLTVSSQAILVSSSFQNPVTQFGAQGIMGLGFTSLSNIDATVSGRNESWGRTFLYNAFAQSPSEPNYMTFSLIRSPNDTKSDEGGFTIGKVDPDYSAVTTTSSLSTWPVSNPHRWNILIDAYETLSGKATFNSSVNGVSKGQAVLLLDTGTSYVYAPTDLVTAMYQNVPGATFSKSAGQWSVPCDQQVFLGFWIGSRRFDLHPLDLVMASLSNANQCIGTFIPQTLAVGSGEFDILAGDVFLRNVYTLFDFGDFTDSSNLTMGDPYVKLISTTNITNATLEFQKIRGGTSVLNITNPTNSGSGGTSSSQSPSPTAAGVSLADLQRKIDHLQNMQPIFFAVLGVNALIMATAVGLGVWFCCCRRKKGSSENVVPRRPQGRRGRGSTNGNTLSTMELTTKGDNGTSYAAVSLQNPDGEPLTPPAIQSTYEGSFPGDRHSTVSFRTDPFRHSRTLSGVSAFRPMMPAPAGAAITITGPDPQTPLSDGGFDATELTVPSPVSQGRGRVSSTPTLAQARRHDAVPPPGAMVTPGATERYRHASFSALASSTVPEGEANTPASVQQPSPVPFPAAAEQSSNPTSLAPQHALVHDPPSQQHPTTPGMGMPFPTSEPPPTTVTNASEPSTVTTDSTIPRTNVS